jgi:hypothetical protein
MKMSLRVPMPPTIAECLDRLDALLAAAPPLFSPGRRAARDGEIRQVLRQLREFLSGEVRQAEGLQAQAEAVLRQAQDEARQIVMAAEERARQAADEDAPTRTADQEEQHIREHAIREADETRHGADLYALGVMDRLEQEVARILATVQRGKAILSERTGGRVHRGGSAQLADATDRSSQGAQRDSAAAARAPARLDNGKMPSI